MSDNWESVGPFKDYRLVVNGWQVPLLDVRELDGGKVSIVLDERLGMVAESIKEANRVVPFIANVIAVCWGYGAHPMADEWYEDNGFDNPFEDRSIFSAVPHPTLAPRRIKEIVSAEAGEPDPPELPA